MTDQVQDQDVELNDDENVVEAHDPKNAEEDSIASVDKAENAGKTAAKRKGDKADGEKSIKPAATKANKVDYIYHTKVTLTPHLHLFIECRHIQSRYG